MTTYTLSRTESTSHRQPGELMRFHNSPSRDRRNGPVPYWKNLTAEDMGRTVVEVAHHALNYPLGMAERIAPKATAALTKGEPFKLGPFTFHARAERSSALLSGELSKSTHLREEWQR